MGAIQGILLLLSIAVLAVIAFRERETSFASQLRGVSKEWESEGFAVQLTCEYKNTVAECYSSLNGEIATGVVPNRLRGGGLLLLPAEFSSEISFSFLYDGYTLSMLENDTVLHPVSKVSPFHILVQNGKYFCSLVCILCLGLLGRHRVFESASPAKIPRRNRLSVQQAATALKKIQ